MTTSPKDYNSPAEFFKSLTDEQQAALLALAHQQGITADLYELDDEELEALIDQLDQYMSQY